MAVYNSVTMQKSVLCQHFYPKHSFFASYLSIFSSFLLLLVLTTQKMRDIFLQLGSLKSAVTGACTSWQKMRHLCSPANVR